MGRCMKGMRGIMVQTPRASGKPFNIIFNLALNRLVVTIRGKNRRKSGYEDRICS